MFLQVLRYCMYNGSHSFLGLEVQLSPRIKANFNIQSLQSVFSLRAYFKTNCTYKYFFPIWNSTVVDSSNTVLVNNKFILLPVLPGSTGNKFIYMCFLPRTIENKILLLPALAGTIANSICLHVFEKQT
jgi:hypothetical protein